MTRARISLHKKNFPRRRQTNQVARDSNAHHCRRWVMGKFTCRRASKARSKHTRAKARTAREKRLSRAQSRRGVAPPPYAAFDHDSCLAAFNVWRGVPRALGRGRHFVRFCMNFPDREYPPWSFFAHASPPAIPPSRWALAIYLRATICCGGRRAGCVYSDAAGCHRACPIRSIQRPRHQNEFGSRSYCGEFACVVRNRQESLAQARC